MILGQSTANPNISNSSAVAAYQLGRSFISIDILE